MKAKRHRVSVRVNLTLPITTPDTYLKASRLLTEHVPEALKAASKDPARFTFQRLANGSIDVRVRPPADATGQTIFFIASFQLCVPSPANDEAWVAALCEQDFSGLMVRGSGASKAVGPLAHGQSIKLF